MQNNIANKQTLVTLASQIYPQNQLELQTKLEQENFRDNCVSAKKYTKEYAKILAKI